MNFRAVDGRDTKTVSDSDDESIGEREGDKERKRKRAPAHGNVIRREVLSFLRW